MGGKKQIQNGREKRGGVQITIALRHWQDVGCLEKQLQAAWRRLWPALRTRSTISKASMFNSSRRALRFASFFTNEVANACSTRCFQNKGNKSPSRCAANRNTLRQLLWFGNFGSSSWFCCRQAFRRRQWMDDRNIHGGRGRVQTSDVDVRWASITIRRRRNVGYGHFSFDAEAQISQCGL